VLLLVLRETYRYNTGHRADLDDKQAITVRVVRQRLIRFTEKVRRYCILHLDSGVDGADVAVPNESAEDQSNVDVSTKTAADRPQDSPCRL